MLRLLEIPWWYFIIAAAIGIIVGLWKKPSFGILAGYTFLLLAETVLIRTPFTGTHFQPVPFWSWRAWKVQKNQILTNVIMFIPVGVIVSRIWKWRGLLFGAGLSIIIEVMQLATGRGLCEIDDVLHNVLGTAMGALIAILVSKLLIAEDTE